MNDAMIFHHPLPLVSDGASGSRVRPYRMARAFEELGLEVVPVTGYAAERRRAMASIHEDVRRGRRFLHVYAESSTMPYFLTDPSHLPLHPLQDIRFLIAMRRHGVPVGLFYRDVHWRIDHYREYLVWYKRWVEIPFYHIELRAYRRSVDHLFLPALAMQQLLPSPWPEGRVSALPPGADIQNPSSAAPPSPGRLRLLYVGGVVPPLYDLRPMLHAVQSVDGCELTLCCRPAEWARVRSLYEPIDDHRVRVVHAQGGELTEHYGAADVFLMAWEHHHYWDLTVPVKVPEALGYGLPIIGPRGTEAGRIVETEGVGWTVGGVDELKALLNRLRDGSDELEQKRQAVLKARERHTWTQRARQVVGTMAAYRGDAS